MLSVIIVNYNVKYFLEQCLFSVFKAGKNIAMEVIVVDNNSTDGSAQYIQSIFTKVRYHISKENLGFSKACNYGLQLSLGSHILFLNPDTILPEDSLERCIDFLDSKTNAGALGVRMLDGSGNFLKESKRGNPTLLNSFFKLSGLASLFPSSSFFSGYYMANINEHQTNTVKVLSGAFMMVHKKTLETTGSFDEQFFMYGEDIDLSYRIQNAGYNNYYFPEVSIIHFKGESTQKGSYQYIHTFYNAMRIFVRKHYKGGSAFLYRNAIESAIFFRAIISFLGKKAGAIMGKSVQLSLQYKTNTSTENNKLFVAGSEESTENARKIAENAGFMVTVTKLVETEINYNYPIVFCEGEKMCFKEIIQLLDNKKLSNVMICSKGSKSIVGSSEKNTTGETISTVKTG